MIDTGAVDFGLENERERDQVELCFFGEPCDLCMLLFTPGNGEGGALRACIDKFLGPAKTCAVSGRRERSRRGSTRRD